MKNTFLTERKILVDGTVQYIHGLVHGNPWVSINPLFKEEVTQQLEGYSVLCEDGFISWISNAVSMREVQYFNLETLSLSKRISFFVNFLSYNLFYAHREPESKIVAEVKRMKSVKDLTKVKEQLFETYLSEPEGMNSLMMKANSGTIDSPSGNIPLRVRRYIYEAKCALDYAKKNDLKELHLVVGCAHELPLEYLLSHKEILDNYTL